jgi:hypothetical protein
LRIHERKGTELSAEQAEKQQQQQQQQQQRRLRTESGVLQVQPTSFMAAVALMRRVVPCATISMSHCGVELLAEMQKSSSSSSSSSRAG